MNPLNGGYPPVNPYYVQIPPELAAIQAQTADVYNNVFLPAMGGQPGQPGVGPQGGAQPHGEQPQEEGIFKRFCNGIGQGVSNLLKSLATPQGLLMAAGGLLLTAVCPPAGLILAGIGIASGGIKMATSMAQGDWEGAGEGFFTASVSYLARKGLSKEGALGSETRLASLPENAGVLARTKNFFNPQLEVNGQTTTTFGAIRNDFGNFAETNATLSAGMSRASNAWNSIRSRFSRQSSGTANSTAEQSSVSTAQGTAVQHIQPQVHRLALPPGPSAQPRLALPAGPSTQPGSTASAGTGTASSGSATSAESASISAQDAAIAATRRQYDALANKLTNNNGNISNVERQWLEYYARKLDIAPPLSGLDRVQAPFRMAGAVIRDNPFQGAAIAGTISGNINP